MSNDRPATLDWRTAGPEARLTDADAARPPSETTFADAQEEVNFVVFDPEWLPEDCEVTETTKFTSSCASANVVSLGGRAASASVNRFSGPAVRQSSVAGRSFDIPDRPDATVKTVR